MADKLGSGSAQTKQVQSRDVNWADFVPKYVASEDTMSPDEVARVWEKMMQYAGLRTPDEAARQSFRMAVYAYALKNGTSREGSYSGKIQMSTGFTFEASAVPRATGKMNIRKFFRGNLEESYDALKTLGAVAGDERLIAKASVLGVDASCAFAMADWMSDCPKFTASERAAYDKSFNFSLSRARRARNGHTLEGVESGRVDNNLEVQGPAVAPETTGFKF